MAAVNDEIDRLHTSLGLADSDMFCECGHKGCAERVKLSRDEFAALRSESRRLIVAAHVNDREVSAANVAYEDAVGFHGS